ncbi:MAG: cysteine desulfurase family protein [Planctomycetota bacterium]
MTAPARLDPPVYLDNAATTRPSARVVEAMTRAHRDQFGNPSSAHSFGPGPKALLQDAREFLRGTLGAAQLVFTSGGSEADHLGIVGSAMARSPGRVLMAESDHPAILACAPLLGRFRHHVTALPVTAYGDLDPERLFAALGNDVRTVALLHGHNELGTLSQLDELVSLVRRAAPDAHVHVDLVQTYGKLPFDLDAMDVDSVAVSGHKFHGPRGAGFLALSSKARVEPWMKAGGQEHGLRGGTENLAGAVGLQVAAEDALLHQAATERHTRALCEHVAAALQDALPGTERLGHPERRLPHVLSLRIPGVNGETLMLRCSERGVAFSTGSACHGADDHADAPAPRGRDRDRDKPDNHVLAAIGMDRRTAREVVRLSFCGDTTAAEVEAATAVVVEEARALREQAPRPRARR